MSINKTSWQLKRACDLINSVIRLTEMMSCMTMIALCCIGINESEDPQTGKEEECRHWWCHGGDEMRRFQLWSQWQSTYQRMSHITRVTLLLSSSHHDIDDSYIPTCFLFHLSSGLPPLQPLSEGSYCTSTDLLTRCWQFFFFTPKKKKTKQTLNGSRAISMRHSR